MLYKVYFFFFKIHSENYFVLKTGILYSVKLNRKKKNKKKWTVWFLIIQFFVCLLFFQIIKIANLSNSVPVINTNVNRFKEILTCTEINEYVLTTYNVFTNAFRCKSLHSFFAVSRKFSQGFWRIRFVCRGWGVRGGGGGPSPGLIR